MLTASMLPERPPAGSGKTRSRERLWDLGSGTWQRKHHGLQARLLEMMISGKGLGDATPLHDHEGEAIREAPVFVGAAPV